MTLPKIASFLAICSLPLASGLGCQQPHPRAPADGAIHFVVRPHAGFASEPPRGSFDVRGLDNDEHARVGLGSSSARTVRLRLPAGTYAVAWNPGPSDSGDGTVSADAAQKPQIIVVPADGPATVDVFLGPRGTHTEPRFELTPDARASL